MTSYPDRTEEEIRQDSYGSWEAAMSAMRAQFGPLGTIIGLVERNLDLSRAELLGRSRQRPVVRARFAAVWLARETTRYSYPRIGRYLGRRDHTTVINAYRRARELRQSDPAFRAMTDRLRERLAR